MTAKLKVMCWNIEEGKGDPDQHLKENDALGRIADHIRAKSPDVVLLNEVVNYNLIWGWTGGYVRQAKKIAELAGLPQVVWGDVNALGWVGHKAVAVLSTLELAPAVVFPIMNGSSITGYGTLGTSFTFANMVHHVFSTRFDAYNEVDNIAGYNQALALIRNTGPVDPILFGGDLNTRYVIDKYRGTDKGTRLPQQFTDFSVRCGLANALDKHPIPVPEDPPSFPDDFIFYRGPYYVSRMEMERTDGKTSDHPWVFVELTLTPPDPKPFHGLHHPT